MKQRLQRVHFSIPENALRVLRKDANSRGISMAEMVRRILEKHYNEG